MKHKGDIIRCPGSQPTYEELKPVKPLHDGKFEVGSQPTYEELKLQPGQQQAAEALVLSLTRRN